MRALWALVLLCWAGAVGAQEFSGLARVDGAQSRVVDGANGAPVVELWLSQAVPWRVFTLEAPRRLVLDFREVDWRGAEAGAMAQSAHILGLRFGRLRPGWSRMVVDLDGAFGVAEAGMRVDPIDTTAHLRVALRPVAPAVFAADAGAPPDPGWDALAALDMTRAPPAPAQDGALIVAIDPGHGGIDPGAQRGGVREADLMLELAQDLAEALRRSDGLHPVLTREADVFVPLQERMTRARAAGAHVFLSLHADALEIGQAAGASVYVLDARGEGQAPSRMAERHGRGDLLAGLDLAEQDDTVAKVLLELARSQTAPQSKRLQNALVAGFARSGARLNSRAARQDALAVLMAADFPSVLIEVGFLSNDADRAALQTPQGRAPLVAGVVLGLRSWADAEAALRPLIGQ